jgi:hypothetical protein
MGREMGWAVVVMKGEAAGERGLLADLSGGREWESAPVVMMVMPVGAS